MQVAGLPTNINFLQKLTDHWAFENGQVETHFIENFKKDLFDDPNDSILASGAYYAAKLGATLVAACVCQKEVVASKGGVAGKLVEVFLLIFLVVLSYFIVILPAYMCRPQWLKLIMVC